MAGRDTVVMSREELRRVGLIREGEQIPLECRIFSIMDAYDAMTNTRPYRKGMGKKQAIKELRRCSGTQFEPRLVDELIGSLGRK